MIFDTTISPPENWSLWDKAIFSAFFTLNLQKINNLIWSDPKWVWVGWYLILDIYLCLIMAIYMIIIN